MQDLLHEDVRSKSNSGNSCCRSVLAVLPSRLLSRNVQCRRLRSASGPSVPCGRDGRSVTLTDCEMSAGSDEDCPFTAEDRSERRLRDCGRDNNEQLHDSHCSCNRFTIVKSRWMRSADRAARGSSAGEPQGDLEVAHALQRVGPFVLRSVAL